MPYIAEESRPPIDRSLADLMTRLPTLGVGDLNYAITRLLQATGPESYAEFNALVGVLECCKLEFYRRAVAAYEDVKVFENGDVYDD